MRPGLLRQLFFWTHLVAGIAASLVIAIMSITGVALTFQPQMEDSLSRAERRLDAAPTPAERLPLEALVEAARKQHPDLAFNSLSVFPEEDAAVLLQAGRRGGVWVHPVTAETWEANATGGHKTLRWLVGLHRWLALEGGGRTIGKALTGASNLAFLWLAVSGIVLWFPRRWTKQALRSVAWFRGGLKGKARDFNWHNAIGLWTSLVLVVVIASGVVISYGWASNLVYRVVGEEPPARGPRGGGGPKVEVPAPAQGATALPLATLVEHAAKSGREWERLSISLPPAPGGERGKRGGRGGSGKGGPDGGATTPRPVAVTLRAAGETPVNANHQLQLDPFTGAVLQATAPSDASAGRRLRSWLRFLHTGEALGLFGQILAGLASLGAVVLVWTGLALSWRRFFRRRRTATGAKESLSASAGDAIPELNERSVSAG